MVLSSEGLEVDESLLTGEAESIVKNVNDRVLSGSIVVAGEGYVRTGAGWGQCLCPLDYRSSEVFTPG
ncbi:MAG TPA: hypothetical protein VN476_18765 [Pyrinomonadaceae bacterium]|nr:hypothetical protein [Pyrinomonadaceae bacterium]